MGAHEEPELVIPFERMPAGLAERLESPPDPPVEAKSAATVALVRDGERGLDILLLRRHRGAGFVPGAYVFPGGRVDAADMALAEALAAHAPAGSPAAAFRIAAVREVFEETGVLLACAPRADRTATGEMAALARWRARLLDDDAVLANVLDAAGLRLDLTELLHLAHWITPLAEPRRYDTHFFLAVLPDGAAVVPDPREMTDALWLRPRDALERFRAGTLPMVFPTVKVLERLSEFASARAARDALRDERVRTIMPRLVRTKDGIGFLIDEEGRDS